MPSAQVLRWDVVGYCNANAHAVARQVRAASARNATRNECNARSLNHQLSTLNIPKFLPSSTKSCAHRASRSMRPRARSWSRASDTISAGCVCMRMPAESAQAVNARAFTVGQNVVFATGEFAPHTPLGRQVLAHELTHTIQQAPPLEAPLRSTNLKISESSDASEQQADRIARTINTPLRGQPIVGEYSEVIPLEAARLQRLGANPGCTAAEKATVHQAIFNARGWLNKAIPKVEATPLSAEALATIRRNFGPTYGASENAGLIAGRLRAAYHGLSNNPYGCGGAEVALCAAGFGASTVPGSHASTVCRNVTLVAGRSPIYQAGVVLHESFHAAFSGFTAAVDSYSGWHGASGSTPGYPGVGKGPLLNADTYTTLVIELS